MFLCRIRNLRIMHGIMQRMRNKDAYKTWTNYVHDRPEEEDFEFIANDIESYEDCVYIFVRLIDKYGSDGILEKL